MFMTVFLASGMQNVPAGRIALPLWLFWFFIILILGLVVLLFLRDKALRKGVSRLISRTKVKIEKSRIQTRIKRQEKDLEEAMLELGEKSRGIRLEPQGTEEIRRSLTSIDEKAEAHSAEQEKFDSQKADLDKTHEEFVKAQDGKINDVEAKKKPHADRLSLLRDDFTKVEKDLQKSQKEVHRFDGQIKSGQKDLEKIAADTKLSDTEKKVKKDVLQAEMNKNSKESEALKGKIPSLEESLNNLGGQIKEEEKEVGEFDAMLKDLAEEKKDAQQKYEKETGVLKKQSAEINKALDELDRRRKPLFQKFGEAVFKERPENGELTVFFSRIDSLNASLKTLKEEMQRLSG